MTKKDVLSRKMSGADSGVLQPKPKKRGKLIQNAKRIISTGEIIVSNHVHDFVEASYIDSNKKKREVFTDGGKEYVHGTLDDPNEVEELFIWEDSPIEEAQQRKVWGTYGKNGDEELRYVRLVDCSSDHLENILAQVDLSSNKEAKDKKMVALYRKIIRNILKGRNCK